MFGDRLASAAEVGGPSFKKFKLNNNTNQQENYIYDSD